MTWAKFFMIATALLAFHRLDGHIVWVNSANVNTVQGAGQLGFPTGTLLSVGGDHVTVRENVNQVIEIFRLGEAKAK